MDIFEEYYKRCNIMWGAFKEFGSIDDYEGADTHVGTMVKLIAEHQKSPLGKKIIGLKFIRYDFMDEDFKKYLTPEEYQQFHDHAVEVIKEFEKIFTVRKKEGQWRMP